MFLKVLQRQEGNTIRSELEELLEVEEIVVEAG